MKQLMRDERAVRGAAEEGAKAYLRAMAVLGILLALKVLSLTAGRGSWPGLAVEALVIPTGALLVVVQRFRLGLWGKKDDVLRELLQSARAQAFSWMYLISAVVMLLGIVFDRENRALHQFSGCIMLLINSHLHSVCVRKGYHHGLVERPRMGHAALWQMLIVFALLAGVLLGASWLMEQKPPEVWEIIIVMILAALVAVSSVRGAHKEYCASESAVDEVLRGAERRAERSAEDGE